MSAEELSAIYIQQINEISAISFDSTATSYEEPNSTEVESETIHWIIDVAGERYKKQQKYDDEEGTSEEILNSDITLSVFYSENQIITPISSAFTIPKNFWRRAIRLESIAYPLGRFENETVSDSIVDIIQSGKQTTFQDEHGFGLQSQTEKFDVRIWFDSEKNNSVKRIRITRQETPTEPWSYTTLEYEVTAFQTMGNAWFPSTYTLRESFPAGTEQYYVPGEGQVTNERKPRTEVTNVTLSEVQFPLELTEADFQCTLPIPNGTPVFMMDTKRTDHMWLNGKIVLKPPTPYYWLMAIGIFYILLACGIKGYGYFKNKK